MAEVAVALAAAVLIAAAPSGARAPAKKNCTRDLGGTLHTGNLLITLCKKYLVTRPYTIDATGGVTIESPIELMPGASLTIHAHGRIVNDGAITSAPLSQTTAVAAQAPAGCPETDVDEDTLFGIVIDKPIRLIGGLTAPDGHGCPGPSIVEFVRSGSIVVDAAIVAGNGGPGRSGAAGRGTAAPECHPSHPVPGTSLTPGATFSDGGNGGEGGSILLETVNAAVGGVTGHLFKVDPGNGGTGGDAIASAPNGGENQGGGIIDAVTGAGGNGGTVTVHERYVVRPNVRMVIDTGRGGAPGSANVTAGNGGAPGCDGGDTVLVVGRKGTGHGDVPRAVVTIHGGDANQTPPSTNAAAGGEGGRGGNTFVYGDSIVVRAAPWARLDLLGTGDGGPGFNGCAMGLPGGQGGVGGSVRADSPGTASISFNGGNGGPGISGQAQDPGLGGAPGLYFSTASKVMSDVQGKTGPACPTG